MPARRDDYDRRLPPRVSSSRQKKAAQSRRQVTQLYRHTVWFVPTTACVLFVVLIAGALGVRKVVVWLQRSNNAMVIADEGIDGNVAGADTTDGATQYVDDDRNLEVMPPLAARQSGRKLPKMLLVGPGENMFPSLEEAIQHAIGGDIVEIRTDGPLYVEPNKVVWQGSDGTLTVRAGNGFRPVLLPKGKNENGTLMSFGPRTQPGNTKVVVQGLTFVDAAPTMLNGAAISSSGVSIDVRECCFVGNHSAI